MRNYRLKIKENACVHHFTCFSSDENVQNFNFFFVFCISRSVSGNSSRRLKTPNDHRKARDDSGLDGKGGGRRERKMLRKERM